MGVAPAPMSTMDAVELAVEESRADDGMSDTDRARAEARTRRRRRCWTAGGRRAPGSFAARARRRELQHNSFFDSTSRGAGAATSASDGRTIEGQPTGDVDDQGRRHARCAESPVGPRSSCSWTLTRAPALALTALRAGRAQRGAARAGRSGRTTRCRRRPATGRALPGDRDGPTHRGPGRALARLAGRAGAGPRAHLSATTTAEHRDRSRAEARRRGGAGRDPRARSKRWARSANRRARNSAAPPPTWRRATVPRVASR